MDNALEDFKNNPNHPCHGKECKDCESCIFDIDIKVKDNNMQQNLTCDFCSSLVKSYLGDDRSKYNACCNRCLVRFNGSTESRPRVIKANVSPMVILPSPDWCPRNKGIVKEYISSDRLLEDMNFQEFRRSGLLLPTTSSSTVKDVSRPLTYTEKRDKLSTMPKHLQWDEIEEDGVYVIPKILYQGRKVIRVVSKTENFLRFCEIDEYGKESQTLTSLYPKDIDAVFITKVLKY